MLKLALAAALICVVFAQDRKKLPENFFVGFRSSGYQVEGGYLSDGKGLSDWDVFTDSKTNPIFGNASGQVAADSYHKIKEDVQALKDLNAQVYSFSLSWSRIFPDGLVGDVNQPGVDYYNNLIDELLSNGIEPIVTLFYWEMPKELAKFGAWANPLVANFYVEYADFVFKTFGDRVKIWITFAKPTVYCIVGYGHNNVPPGISLPGIAEYECAHNILMAHARVYHLYTDQYKEKVNGKIGISLEVPWFEPREKDDEHEKAARTLFDFFVGWLAHPIFSEEGGYPRIMIDEIEKSSTAEGRPQSRLPAFTEENKTFVKGTSDFFGVSHFTLLEVAPAKRPMTPGPQWGHEIMAIPYPDYKNPKTGLEWATVTPWAFRKVLNFIKEEYNNVTIIVTENGMVDFNTTHDVERINYHKGYMTEMLKAIYEDGCNVIGYIVYSLLDEFEWFLGYRYKTGVFQVDFNDEDRPRIPKSSVAFFRKMMTTRIVAAG